MSEDQGEQIERRRPVRAGQRAAGKSAGPAGPEHDERGLTDYDKWRGRQMLCHICHGRPCADSCPEQWLPDRLEWKAARAGLPIEEWARIHADWTRAHAQRPDVAAWLEGQTRPLLQEQAPGDRHAAGSERAAASDARRIPLEGAMAQAMAVVAGEARPQDVAPVYEEVP